MLKLLFLIALGLATGAAIVVLVAVTRNRSRRRLSRTRREVDYAERRAHWSSYLQRSAPRRPRRLTDQREAGE